MAMLAGLAPASLWSSISVAVADAAGAPSLPAALQVPANAVTSATPAGVTPGSGGVQPDGSYSYSIPLDVPAGRAGMAPSLSLSYSSRAGDGPLGIGWTLSGISQITRCPSTLATEGEVRGVKFTKWDSFCLDGQKLVALATDAQYGGNGVEYRTETDQFAKIVSIVNDPTKVNDGPDKFVVYRKDGRIQTYELHNHLQVETRVGFAPGPVTQTVASTWRKAAWPIHTDADRSHNEVRYEYATPSAGGNETLPSKITYTWNTGSSPKLAQRSVEFRYDKDLKAVRPDKSFSYQWGVRFNLDQRLREVVMRAPDLSGATADAWKYTLSYTLNQSSRSMLASVAKCSPSKKCLRAKTFQYALGALPSFSTLPLGAQQVTLTGDDPAMKVADFNGDGADDIVYTTGGTNDFVHVRLSARSGTTGAVSPLLQHVAEDTGLGSVFGGETFIGASRPLDLQSDGTSELMFRYLNASSNKLHDVVARWDPVANKFAQLATPLYFDPESTTDLADLNGDGFLDMATADQQAADGYHLFSIRVGNGSAFDQPITTTLPAACYQRVTDIDGDGRAEVVVVPDMGSFCSQFSYALGVDTAGNPTSPPVSADVNGVIYYSASPVRSEYTTSFGDFNGDGLDDVLLLHTYFGTLSNPDITVLWGTGKGLVAGPSTNLGAGYDHAHPDVRVADLNGDRLDDLVSFNGATTAYFANQDGTFGSGVVISKDSGTLDPEAGRALNQVGDFTGDGRPDLVRVVRNSQTQTDSMSILVQNERYADRMVQVSDEGAPTAWYRDVIEYSTSWTDHAEQTISSYQCSYPLVCPRQGIVVVRKVSSLADSANGQNTAPRVVQYSYEDPVGNVRGRGFLGFGTVRSWDAQAASEVVATYDHRTVFDGKYYPGVKHPSEVTTTVAVMDQSTVPTKPATATARTSHTIYTRQLDKPYPVSSAPIYQLVSEHLAYTVVTEQPVAIDWSATLVGHSATLHLTDTGAATTIWQGAVVNNYDQYGNNTLTGRNTLAVWPSTQLGTSASTSTVYDLGQGRIDDWLISLPSNISVVSTEPNVGTTTRRTDTGYDTLGRLRTVDVEKRDNPADEKPELRSTTTYDYDALGVVRKTTLSTPGLADRVSHTDYAPLVAGWPDEEVHPTQLWSEHNVASNRPSTWTITHPAYGIALAAEDANGVTSTARIDDLGRPVEITKAGESPAQLSYANRQDTGGVIGAVTTNVHNAITARTSTDGQGRVIANSITGFDGSESTTSTTYDVLGRLATTTAPAPGGITKHAYDTLGREKSTTRQDGSRFSYTYPDPFTTKAAGTDGRVSVVVTDLDGRVTSHTGKLVKPDQTVEDVTTTYTYQPFDLVDKVIDDAGNSTDSDYDILGRPTHVDEPDRGVTDLTYYGTGEVHTTTRSEAGTTTAEYDDLGRTVKQTNVTGWTTSVSTFVFDTTLHGIGQLASASSPDGILTQYRYDAAGRRTGTDITDQTAAGLPTMSVDENYNASGQPSTVDYPDLDGTGGLPRFGVSVGYTMPGTGTTHGYPVTVSTTGSSPQTLWSVQSRKPNLALDTATLGSGAGAVTVQRTYDSGSARLHQLTATAASGTTLQDITYGYYPGSLVKTRTQNDSTTGGVARVDTYGYDTLHRLTSWTLTTGTTTAVNTFYTYDTIGNMRFAGAEERMFDGPRPHAMTSHDGPPTGLEMFDYDDTGRLTDTRDEARTVTRHLTYTYFDLPRTVTKDGKTTTFGYDAFGTKIRERTTNNAGTQLSATYYHPGSFERRITTAGTTDVYYLQGTDGAIGQVNVSTTNSGTTTTTEYALPDNQGSTTTTVNTAGQALQTLRYDPWGARTNADGTPFTGTTGNTTHGYTNHEHEDALGLINMKGRHYDPTLKVFTVPDPLNATGANPYAYVNNNPTNMVDPSGFMGCDSGIENKGDNCGHQPNRPRPGPTMDDQAFTAEPPVFAPCGCNFIDEVPPPPPAASDDSHYHSAVERMGSDLDYAGDHDQDGLATAEDFTPAPVEQTSDSAYAGDTVVLMTTPPTADSLAKARDWLVNDVVKRVGNGQWPKLPDSLIDAVFPDNPAVAAGLKVMNNCSGPGACIKEQEESEAKSKPGTQSQSSGGAAEAAEKGAEKTASSPSLSNSSSAAEVDLGSLKGLSNNYAKKVLKDIGTDPHAFKADFVGKNNVSRFDMLRGGDGQIFLVSKDQKVVIPTNFFPGK